jgi:nanoRNase/pAp phosphatase (c-di-AMP/oligoRNAs hydrolase)
MVPMRLVTRSDFDGLACAVLLKSLGLIKEYKFAHPKDLQDGIIEVSENDILANVPYVPGCGMWFDHHSSEEKRLGKVDYKGMTKVAPSCARVIWEYFGGHDKFPARLEEMLAAVDKVDSGQLSYDEIMNPQGWILLGYIMDPRTGLGRYRDYRISNYQLMLDMIDYCSDRTVEEILEIPDVEERSYRYREQEAQFQEMARKHCTLHGNVLLFDLRDQQEIYPGNRFTIYALYPECNVSLQVIWGLKKQNIVFTCGYSILNRTCTVDIGALMLKYGGGGHKQVGTCQVPTEKAEQVLAELLEALKG